MISNDTIDESAWQLLGDEWLLAWNVSENDDGEKQGCAVKHPEVGHVSCRPETCGTRCRGIGTHIGPPLNGMTSMFKGLS